MLTLEQFRATKTTIKNGQFFEEMALSDETAAILVYDDRFFIEVLADGRRMLTIENRGWIEPHTTLEQMESELFEYAKFWE